MLALRSGSKVSLLSASIVGAFRRPAAVTSPRFTLFSCRLLSSVRGGTVILDTEDILIVQRPVGAFQMNQYFIGCKSSKEAALIDCGEDPSEFFDECANKGQYKVSHLIQTHAHIDHVGGLKPTKEKYPDAPIYMHEADLPVYNSVLQTAAMYGLSLPLPLPKVDKFIVEGGNINVGDIKLDILFTPGHCPGHCVFLHKHTTVPFAFVGDLIFKCSVGRTDLPLCDHALMEKSIRRIVKDLPQKTLLLPGHMGVTTMEEEIAHNPFVIEWCRDK